MFNSDEVFEIAIQIERNGKRFYQRASQAESIRRNPQVRDLLQELADLEGAHEAVFQELRDTPPQDGGPVPAVDPTGEVAQYLQSMATGQIFNLDQDPANTLTGRETLEQIIRMALKREEDSIAYYTAMKKCVPQELGKAHIDALIREESEHAALLRRLLSRLEN